LHVPKDHPRAESLQIREKIIEGMYENIVAEAGLIAHGRGEAYDYLLGEESPDFAKEQEKAAIALLLTAEKPVISVNGNVAALCSEEIVELSELVEAPLEINLFYRRPEREKAIKKKLLDAGAKHIFGLDPDHQTTIDEITHNRRIVDKRGIYESDVVLVPLEDGDRTMALRKLGKRIITIDLNPLSRTSISSNITIVNNLIRAIPEMIEIAKQLENETTENLEKIIKDFDNHKTLQISLKFISNRLKELGEGSLEKLIENKE
jgi:4-phosphopantoate--beta-alanine ligase